MVWVNADIDMTDIDDDELVIELESRGYKCLEDGVGEEKDLDLKLILAFKFKKLDEVINLVRADLEERKGIVL